MSEMQRKAKRAHKTLVRYNIEMEKNKPQVHEYYKRFSAASLTRLPHFSKPTLYRAMEQMTENGYEFDKTPSNAFKLSIDDIHEIYKFRKQETYKASHPDAIVVPIINLKGGVSKTVTTCNVAHCLRTHPDLLHHNLKSIVLDFDPQGSASLFMDNIQAAKNTDSTSIQAALNDVSIEQLKEHYILPSTIQGVDFIPASVEDGFIASKWNELTKECSPHINPLAFIKNLTDKLKKDYDFIFVDVGPHLDDILRNTLYAADILCVPIPPATVDFNSTLKFIKKLPDIFMEIKEAGLDIEEPPILGYMTKFKASKKDHQGVKALAGGVFGGDLLGTDLVSLDGFERSGETFDTVVSADPKEYDGSVTALRDSKQAIEMFTHAFFTRIEYLRETIGDNDYD